MAGFDGTVLCWIPDIPVVEKDEWRLKKAQFGDGYQQRTLDGINALNRTWTLTWYNRTEAVTLAILSYLANRNAASFPFYDPASMTTWNVFCDTWSVSWNLRRRSNNNYGTITADFYKANGAKL